MELLLVVVPAVPAVPVDGVLVVVVALLTLVELAAGSDVLLVLLVPGAVAAPQPAVRAAATASGTA